MAKHTRPIIIIGAGGTAQEIVETLLFINDSGGGERWEIVGFLDDNEPLWNTSIDGYPVLGPLSEASSYANCVFVNAIGSPRNWLKRPGIIDRIAIPRERFVNVIHPTAVVARTATLGRGLVILQHVTIGSHAYVGDHVTILAGTIVNHHSRIGDFCCLCAGVCVSGNVTVHRNGYIGTGAVIRDGVVVGENCLIGMGSVVVGPVEPNTVVSGNPARVLRRASESQQ